MSSEGSETTPQSSKEIELIGNMDAAAWTNEFLRIKPDANDWGTMVGWFANAIMAGYDTAMKRNRESPSVGSSATKMVEVLKQIQDHCLCTRNTYGFDYGEKHPHLGKPAAGKRWLTPVDIAKECAKRLNVTAEGESAKCTRCKDLYYDPKTMIESERQRAAEWEEIAERHGKRIAELQDKLSDAQSNWEHFADLHKEAQNIEIPALKKRIAELEAENRELRLTLERYEHETETIQEVKAENARIIEERARYRTALEWLYNNRDYTILIEDEKHVAHFFERAKAALQWSKGDE